LIKNKLGKDSKGIATLIIVIIVVIIIAGAGVTAYVVLSNNGGDNTDNGDGGDGTTSALGGPGLKANDILDYQITANMSAKSGTATVGLDDIVTGSFTLKFTPESSGDYTVKFEPNITIKMDPMDPGFTLDEAQTFTVDALDMGAFGNNTTDLADLSELGYSAEDIEKIQALIEKFSTATVSSFSTVDGTIKAEKRSFSFSWSDFMDLIPSDFEEDVADIPIADIIFTMDMWFGKDILYKATFSFTIITTPGTEVEEMTFSGEVLLLHHQK